MNRAEFLAILQSYSCSQVKIPANETEKEILRQAIIHITGLSDWQNFGICASELKQGLFTLQQYLLALGYPLREIATVALDDAPGVYLKYNTSRMSHLIEPYLGEYRGVLISLQSDDPEIAGIYGYFPLDLF